VPKTAKKSCHHLSETEIQRELLEYLNAIPECIAEVDKNIPVKGRSNNSKFQKNFRSDINGCIKGRSFKIEVKEVEVHEHIKRNLDSIISNPKKYQERYKGQYDYMQEWKIKGALVGFASSIDDVNEILKIDK
jgi:hypothetical protein